MIPEQFSTEKIDLAVAAHSPARNARGNLDDRREEALDQWQPVAARTSHLRCVQKRRRAAPTSLAISMAALLPELAITRLARRHSLVSLRRRSRNSTRLNRHLDRSLPAASATNSTAKYWRPRGRETARIRHRRRASGRARQQNNPRGAATDPRDSRAKFRDLACRRLCQPGPLN